MFSNVFQRLNPDKIWFNISKLKTSSYSNVLSKNFTLIINQDSNNSQKNSLFQTKKYCGFFFRSSRGIFSLLRFGYTPFKKSKTIYSQSIFKVKDPSTIAINSRQIWGWLNSIFNRVDESRIYDAGPDRACAEWLLRCGAGVKWMNSEHFVKDYNSLPLGGGKLFKIEEIDATDSAIMHIGFPHFRNCKHIRRIVFHKASYLSDEALSELHYLKASLKELQISSCGNISREGLNHIKKLKNLEYLLLYDLPLIKDKEEVIKDIEKALPKCTVYFPYAQASERPQEEEST